MFLFHTSQRTFHTSCMWMANNKTLLAKLRKSTGYTFANCKKALEVSNYDFIKAEEWLKEQALVLGWAKAAKVAGRSTLQGLIAVTTDPKTAAMIEVNCETDFVAKNSAFQDVVIKAANACFAVAKNQTNFSDSIAKLNLDSLQLKKLPGSDGKLLEDEIALLVSQIGENVTLRRATCLKVTDNLLLAGCTHPYSGKLESTLTGKYGSLLVYKAKSNDENVANIAKQLCQHVIGMKPTKIGDIEKDLPKENKDEETVMIHQEFIMESETPVFEIITSSEISLIEFTRFECGEALEGNVENNTSGDEEIKLHANANK